MRDHNYSKDASTVKYDIEVCTTLKVLLKSYYFFIKIALRFASFTSLLYHGEIFH